MKKLSTVIAIIVIISAVTVWAAGRRAVDSIGQPVDQFFPASQSSEAKTKGTITVSTTSALAVRYKTSAVTSMTINGAGSSWPTVANTPETVYIRPDVTSLVFTCTSSATPTTVYYQVQQ